MAIDVVHVIDGQAVEHETRLCSLLLAKLPRDRVSQGVVLLGGRPAGLEIPADVRVDRVAHRPGWLARFSSDLRSVLQRYEGALGYAWGGASALAMSSWPRGCQMIAVACDPADAETLAGRWRRRGRGRVLSAVVCSSELIRRRVVQAQVPAQTVVVRPGLDFSTVDPSRRQAVREGLDLSPDAKVLLTPSPPSRAGGQYYAIWASAILNLVWPEVRLIVPGRSREHRRLDSLADHIGRREAFRLPGNRYGPADLLAASDMLVASAIGDVATDWLGWAMGASVPIVASAVPAVRELIEDERNGFLCPPREPHALATRLRKAFEATEVRNRCVALAREQALSQFGVQRCVDQHLAVIEQAASRRGTAADIEIGT